ncbi:histone deacetylase family protein [Desulfosporosinus youngiae]|uniref:Deacetylase, histone deacetylase/acetoin utilization protein n=1 Tax=Desulfosporosinus youngiae DSM 17734 TaxID=768710 RepID=H5Y4A7_9FIRM|nr:histone deacetylase [Desulfosporosinus youngiae]EHQ89935.1 deacetylase, histone deacetylase/acetoin utilization protein [Desulfosporosinus youngiae DSM 17734]
MKRTGLLFFPAFDWSLGDTHPEREERLLYTQEQLFEEGILDLPQIKQFSPRVATIKNVLGAQAILPTPGEHTDNLDPHLIAAGSAILLGEAQVKGEIKNGFVLVRPPGHHSGATVWGNRGFCSLNNEAILVNHLRARFGVKRIAIVDTDVHHGDGTQDIFYHDPNVLFISLHQDGRTLYPGSGFVHEKGGPNAWDQTLNIPLPPGTGDEGYHYVLENWVLPRLQAFAPELIINSAGQDNHFTDPLASMNLSADGYGRITELLQPDLAVLEGGYSIEGALPYVNLAILLALAGEDYHHVREPQKQKRPTLALDALKPYIQELKKQQQAVKPTFTVRKKSDFPDGKWISIPHSVYYDTDGFQESRQDYIRECRNCAGTVYIETRRYTQKSILVRIPFQACSSCEQAGYDLWEQLQHSKDDIKSGFLQNQLQDRYYVWNRKEGLREF